MLRLLMLEILLLPVLACSQAKIRESNKKWSDGLIVATNLCAHDGTVHASKDPEGQRIYCGLEELVGSHIPKCVCRDEAEIADRRNESQQYFREAQQNALQPGSSTSAIISSHAAPGGGSP